MVKKKLKVLLVAEAYHPTVDGTVAVVDAYYHYLMKHHRVMLLAPNSKTHSFYDKEANIYWTRSTWAKSGYRMTWPSFDCRIKKAIIKFNPDIVHCHAPFVLGKFAVKFANKNHIPSILTIHTKYKDEFKRIVKVRPLIAFLMWFIRRTIKRFDEIRTVSISAVKEIEQWKCGKSIGVFYNGSGLPTIPNVKQAIDSINQKYNIRFEYPVFIFIGRIVKNKGLDILINAFRIVKQNSFNFRVIIIGGGVDLNWMQKIVERYGLSDQFIFTGLIKEKEILVPYILRSSALVFPSLFDTDGIVTKECASLGIPSIVSFGSAPSERITNKYNGYVCDNTGKAYAKVIEYIINNAKTNTIVGECARKSLYKSWDDIMPSIVEEYRKIIKRCKH